MTILPVNTYPTGQRTVGPVSIADGINGVTFGIQRCTSADLTIWPDANTTISLLWDVSLDGGVTWNQIGGFSANGGIVNAKGGGELQFSTGSVQFPSGTNRQVRVHTTITGSPVKTSITLTTT